MKVRTEQHGGGDISGRVTFQGTKVRKLLFAELGVIDKGNIVVFDGDGSFMLPGSCAGVASVRKAVTGVRGRIPLHCEKWSVCLADMGTGGYVVDGVSAGEDSPERAEHQAE